MSEIVKINAEDFGLEQTKAAQIETAFKPMLEKMTELESEFNDVLSLEIDKEACKRAKELRLKYVKIRTATAKVHKELKAFYLAGGRFVDGWKNAQLFASQGCEEKLTEIEKHFENIEAEKRASLQAERATILEGFCVEPIPENLGDMDVEVWDIFVSGAESNYNLKLEAEKRAEEYRLKEEARLEQERVAAEKEAEMIKAENERLRKEREEADRKAAEEQAKREYEAKVLKEAHENQMREEREKREAEERKIKEEHQRALEQERKERDRLQAIENDRIAKEKAEAERVYLEKKAAAAAPDKEKLYSLIKKIEEIELPSVNTKEAQKILDGVKQLLGKVCIYVADNSDRI